MSKVTLFLSLVILVIIIPAVMFIWQNVQQTIEEQAHTRAETIYEMIVIMRQWVAENSDRVEPVPAVVTKELSRYADKMTSFKFHITSDKLINPENEPTEFELDAMDNLRGGATEYFKVTTDKELGKIYNYAAPLHINQSCLSCHSEQDYELDDFRGLISISFPMSGIEQSLETNNKIVINIIIITLIIVIITVCVFVYMMITRYLIVLTKAANSLMNGKLMVTDLKTDDEIQDLSQAFDNMSLQIANNEETLKAKLDEAVERYIDLVKELDIKNKKLDSLNKLKTDLLDSVSHEIRTPLTKILSYSELLNDIRVLENEEMRDKFATAMKSNINVIRMMFNDILTISRLEHDQHIYKKIPVKIYDLVSETFASFELDLQSKNLSVDINMDTDDIIHVDGETFSIVITNLASNAIKYSKDGGKIEVVSYISEDEFFITFSDYGVGIPREAINEITKRFYRADNVKKTFAGTGLGLSITSRIVRDHGGKIDIDSELGEYTSVTIRLPLTIVEHADD